MHRNPSLLLCLLLQVCSCVRACACVLAILSSASLPPQSRNSGSAPGCAEDNVYTSSQPEPGRVQVLEVRPGWAHGDHFPPLEDVTAGHVVSLSLSLSFSLAS